MLVTFCFSSFFRSKTPLGADYNISKNSLEADQYFEGLELFKGPELFRDRLVWNLEADWDFEGPKLEADRRSERSGLSRVISKQTGILKVWNSNSKWTRLGLGLRLGLS
ncbi:hypothetical protein RclHR1_00740005 [Rhizophagus clarus]|uniref:Uncharacterized protein n=1 Tax=Rhizophagus clarus TaxID=94130 RepID=A0A2Z6SCX6_9GLOM|nr:hypothetical protein RclHR1_00740005 [Rhizophagus clarus]